MNYVIKRATETPIVVVVALAGVWVITSVCVRGYATVIIISCSTVFVFHSQHDFTDKHNILYKTFVWFQSLIWWWVFFYFYAAVMQVKYKVKIWFQYYCITFIIFNNANFLKRIHFLIWNIAFKTISWICNHVPNILRIY